jgi:hypothetical protein
MKPAAHRELLAWALVATLTAVQLLSTASLFGQTNSAAWYGVQRADTRPLERGAESAASCEALLRQLEVCTKQLEKVARTEIRTGPTADLPLAEDGGSSDPLSAAAPLPDVAEITLHVNVTGFTPISPRFESLRFAAAFRSHTCCERAGEKACAQGRLRFQRLR